MDMNTATIGLAVVLFFALVFQSIFLTFRARVRVRGKGKQDMTDEVYRKLLIGTVLLGVAVFAYTAYRVSVNRAYAPETSQELIGRR